MVRIIITHLIYLLISSMLAYYLVSQVRGPRLSQYDWVSVVLLAVLAYSFLMRLHPRFYFETFQLNPNIAEKHIQDYQEDNYQQAKKSRYLHQKHSGAATCVTNVNVFSGDPVAPAPAPTSTSAPAPTPPSAHPTEPHPSVAPPQPDLATGAPPGPTPILGQAGLGRLDKERQAQALSSSPCMAQRFYDDGRIDHTPAMDPAVLHHLRSQIHHELNKHYPNSVKEKDAPYAMSRLRDLVTQRIDERMPYLDAQVRKFVMTNLDKIIDEELDKVIGQKGHPRVLPHHLEGTTQVGSLKKNDQGHPEYIPETYMDFFGKINGDIQDNRVYYDHPRAAYQDVDYGWDYQKPQPPLATYVESIYDGIKLGVDRLFHPVKRYLLSNELTMPNRWYVRPWLF